MIELSQKDADELRSIQKRLSKYRAARAERLSKLRWGPIHCAETLLEIGERDGYRYMILHNGMGYRTGYIRVPHNHPWAKNYAARENARMNVRCHGGITFVGRDEQPHGGRPRWWFGFDCAHAWDKPDPKLPLTDDGVALRDAFERMPLRSDWVIRDQDYVREQCFYLIEQAKAAASGRRR